MTHVHFRLTPLLFATLAEGRYGDTRAALRSIANERGMDPKTARIVRSQGPDGEEIYMVGQPGGPFDHTDMD